MKNSRKNKGSKKEFLVDTLGNVSYSLVVGSLLDYVSGLRGLGIVTSRTYATGVNTTTGGLYGKWRNFVFKVTKTSDSSNKLKKYLVDLLAFNTAQVPIYASAVALGSFVSEGKVDLEKVTNGARNLAIISPLIGPTMGWYMDIIRKCFGLKSAAEKVEDPISDHSNKDLENVIENEDK